MSSSLVNVASRADPNTRIRISRNIEYPNEVWYFVACLVSLISLFHILSFFWSLLRKAVLLSSRYARDEHSGEGARSPRPTHSLSLRRIPLAITSAFRIAVFRTTVQFGSNFSVNLAETSIITLYLVAILTWEFIYTRNTMNQNLDVAYWANRAGAIAASQMPLIVALAGKNNVISLITGISYEKLNILHRGAARVVLIAVWVHLWGRYVLGLTGDTSPTQLLVQTGLLSGTAYTLLTFISIRPLRSLSYEFFYYSHVVLVAIMLFSAYYHIDEVTPSMSSFLWPALLVWGIDRFFRLGRILFFNLPFLHSNTSKSTVELLSQDALRVTVRRRHITWRPGQSMFLNLPKISKFPFESHPFTIASLASSENPENKGEKEIVFLIKARTGLTGRLRDMAREKASGRDIGVIIEGPYGSPPDLSHFSTVMLFSGGSGVSYCLPLLADLVKRTRESKTLCRRIVFVWSVRIPEHMHWISNSLIQVLKDAPSDLQIDLRIQMTSALGISDLPTLEKSQESAENSDEDLSSGGSKVETEDKEDADTEPELASMRGVRIIKGRPHIRSILDEEISCARGPVSVDVCGPHALSEAVRAALASDIAGPMGVLRGRESVTLHVEKFSM